MVNMCTLVIDIDARNKYTAIFDKIYLIHLRGRKPTSNHESQPYLSIPNTIKILDLSSDRHPLCVTQTHLT